MIYSRDGRSSVNLPFTLSATGGVLITSGALEPYAGREQALVKHELLQAYLERFMMILGQHFPTVCYVDCFAGPWESAAEDYRDTSFGRAVRTIRACKDVLSLKHGKRREFRALFIEKDRDAFLQLEKFLADESGPGLRLEAWNASFEEKVDEIARWIGSDFAFVLIDPKGWNGLIGADVLAPLLSKRNVETLINYMRQFISLAIGHLGNAAQRSNLIELFGEEVLGVESVPQSDRERWLLSMYRKRLVDRSCPSGAGRTRTVSFAVEYPGRVNTKYFLVHATHNDLGVIKFAEASREAAAVQKTVRFLVQQNRKLDRSGVEDMFGCQAMEMIQDRADLTSAWLKLLPAVGSEVVVNEAVVADLIQAHDCFIPDLQHAAAELIRRRVIQNLDSNRPRPKNVIHYSGKGERVRRIG